MKKRIISVLSFLTLVICLTGCSTQVTQAKIEEMTAIAQNVKDTPNYQLPEGYTFTYADNTKNDRIIITTAEEFAESNEVNVTFDLAEEEVKVIEIAVCYDNSIDEEVVTAIVLSFIIGLILGFAFFHE